MRAVAEKRRAGRHRMGVGMPLAFLGLAMLLVGSACERGPASPTEGPTARYDRGPGKGGTQPPFDFDDDFYLANGVDPSKILIRVGTPARPSSVWTIDDSNEDPARNDVRILETNGGFDNSGHHVFFTINGVLLPDAFTDDEAGEEAREVANEFRVFIFPRKQADGTFNLTVAPQDRRQDNLFDTRGGYFSNDPLQLWVIEFVMWTDAAFNTPEGRAALADLAEENGLSADGTPVVTDVGDIEDLVDDGFVELIERAKDGSEGFPWVICNIIPDPRDGAIAEDAFLVLVPNADGTDVTPSLRDDFECLQEDGDFCEDD
ncbi:MAG TPA: hypothetical protein VF188_09560 [Longimicrobiales bacterium]